MPLLLVDQENHNEINLESIINITTKVQVSNATLSENILIQKTQITEQLLYEKDEGVLISNGNKSEELEIVQKNSEFFANSTQVKSEWLCYLAQCSTSLVCTTSIFSILLIGIDQYFAVIHSLRYHSYMNKFRSLILISTTWILSVLFAVIGVLTQTNSYFWKFCLTTTPFMSLTPDNVRILRTIYAFIYFTSVILLPFVAICSIYVCIYRAAHKNSERMRQSTSTTLDNSCLQLTIKNQHLPKVRSAPNFVTFQTENETKFLNETSLNQIKPFGNDAADLNETLVALKGSNALQLPLEVNHVKPANGISIHSSNEIPPTKDMKNDKLHHQSSTRLFNEIQFANDTKFSNDLQSTKHLNEVQLPLAQESDIKVTRTSSERSNVNFINNIKCKISNASIFKYREESRAAKISILVIFMVLICYIPYGLSLICNTFRSRTFHYIALILLIISNIISPFLFAYRNRRVQRELLKFFGIKSSKTTRMNSSKNYCRTSLLKQRHEAIRNKEDKPFIKCEIPTVIVTCKVESDKKSILKRVCSANWQNYKKCNFITVPDSCVNGEARGSFSSASTQISNDE